MKRLLSSLVILTILTAWTPLARAQDNMAPPPPPDGTSDQQQPPDQGSGGQYNSDQNGPPPDQGGPGMDQNQDQGQGQDQGPSGDQNGQQGGSDQGGDPGVSYQTFYDNLSNQGTWVQTDDYGYAFQPNVSDPSWAPYTDGHWVYTDVGWTWVSDEPWGWATYHYGRWVNIEDTGWCWVPGYRWAPAWVSWRYGGGYCGWAPLPPATFIGVEFGGGGGTFGGYHFGGDIDVNFHIGAGYYNFVPVGRMGDPNVHGVIVNRYNNYTIINQTTNITNINIGRRGGNSFHSVSIGGPPLAEINAHSEHQIPQVRLAAASRPGRASMQGNTVAFFAPRVNASTVNHSRPANVTRTITHATINRGDSIERPLAVNNRLRPSAPSADLVRQARMAQTNAPASAQIATMHTPIRSSRLAGLAPVRETSTAKTTGTPTGLNAHSTTSTRSLDHHSGSGQTYRPPTQNGNGTPMTSEQSRNRRDQDQNYSQDHHTGASENLDPSTQGTAEMHNGQGTDSYRPATRDFGTQRETGDSQSQRPASERYDGTARTPAQGSERNSYAPTQRSTGNAYGESQRSTGPGSTSGFEPQHAQPHTQSAPAPAQAQRQTPAPAQNSGKTDKKKEPGQ